MHAWRKVAARCGDCLPLYLDDVLLPSQGVHQLDCLHACRILPARRGHAASGVPRRGLFSRRHAASRVVCQSAACCLKRTPPGVCRSEACCLKRTPPGGCWSEACCLVSQPGVRRVRDLMNPLDGRQSQVCLRTQPWVWHSGACCPSVMVACCPIFTPGVCQSEACCLKRTPPGVCQSEACCLVTQPGVRRVRDLMTPPDGRQSEVCLGTQPWVWHSGACCPSVMVACMGIPVGSSWLPQAFPHRS